MKTLREKFKNTEGAINLLHCVFEFFQRCFCVLKTFLWAFLRKSKRIRDASIYTSKKNIAQVLFLSDIFLFPFIRQQFPVLT